MREDAKMMVALLVLLAGELSRGDMSYSVINREDPCIGLCERTPADHPKSEYMKSCCQRGCRFFNLVDLRYGLGPDSLNGTKNACETSCTEAYAELQDRYTCSTGCDFMAKQQVMDQLSIFSNAACAEKGIESNVLLMPPDIPENDILTDPGLRKELLPRWWDCDGFKLPQTYIKTVPMDAVTVDYALSSDYSCETKQNMRWLFSLFPCTSCLKALYVILVACFCAMLILMMGVAKIYWFKNMTLIFEDAFVEKPIEKSQKITLLDEAPLYDEPPPKYIQSFNHNEF